MMLINYIKRLDAHTIGSHDIIRCQKFTMAEMNERVNDSVSFNICFIKSGQSM